MTIYADCAETMRLPKTWSWVQVQAYWDVIAETNAELFGVVYEDGLVGCVDERVKCVCGAKAKWGDYLCSECRG